MKIRIIIWGVLLIVGGMADYIIMPSMFSSVNDLTDSMQRNVMSGLLGNAQASTSFSSASTEMSSAINPLHLLLTSIEHYIQMCSIVMGIFGVGFVTFGGLLKHNKKLYPQTHETPLEILKIRLAKGEITKKEFDNIKQDIQ